MASPESRNNTESCPGCAETTSASRLQAIQVTSTMISGPPDLPDSSQTSQMSSAAFKRPLRWPPGIQTFQIVLRPPRWASQLSRNAIHYGHQTHPVTLGYLIAQASVFNQSISRVNNGLVGSIEVAIGAPKTLKASKQSILNSLNAVKSFQRALRVRHSEWHFRSNAQTGHLDLWWWLLFRLT